jgi:hypothetical protein
MIIGKLSAIVRIVEWPKLLPSFRAPAQSVFCCSPVEKPLLTALVSMSGLA